MENQKKTTKCITDFFKLQEHADTEVEQEMAEYMPSTSTSDSVPPVKKKKKYDDSSRKCKAEWFTEYKWLRQENEKFFCSLCLATKKRNIFTSGKSVKKPKKDDFAKHEKLLDHIMASAGDLPKEMKIAVKKSHEHAREAVMAQMATLLVQAKEAIPTSKNTALLELQLFNVSDILIRSCF